MWLGWFMMLTIKMKTYDVIYSNCLPMAGYSLLSCVRWRRFWRGYPRNFHSDNQKAGSEKNGVYRDRAHMGGQPYVDHYYGRHFLCRISGNIFDDLHFAPHTGINHVARHYCARYRLYFSEL